MLQKVCLALVLAAASAAECSRTTLDFAILQGDAAHEAYAADIAAELAELGLTLNIKPLEKDALNAAMVGGDYDLVFSETWGAPYDPHSYVKSWTSPDEAHYSALPTVGIDTAAFTAEVDSIFADMDEASRRDKWAALLSEVHGEVLHLPLWGKRIPAVVNNQRLSGYVPGAQQFDYPMHKARVVSGPKIVTVAPGAQTGLFTSVGRLDAHSYRPNEFFANNWVYEGLLAYGAGGKVEPALATSWTSEASADGGETFRFTLREGVTFHDGAAFNCAAVKLNFDHVFVEELTTGDWHGWYGLPGVYKESSCDGETFVLTTKTPYYPLLQELTYIRPLRMLSPTAFAGTDPVTENSCPVGWNEWLTNVTCAGATAIAGTGPWKFESRDTNADGDDDEVIFAANAEYWGGAPQFDELHIKRYADSAAVKAALLDGSLDAVVGASVLEPSDEEELGREANFDLMSQNTVIIMNIADTDIRKAVVHGVNKRPIIESELNEAYEPAEQLFPPTLPYCDVDLTPKFAYDAEKADWLCSGFGAAECADAEITFALLQGDAAHEAYANDIAAELKELGITVTQKPLEKDALNAAMVGGDYDMVFSETWGAPYDPHSYVKSWTAPDEAHYSALPTVGIDPAAFTAEVDAIFADMDEASRRDKWAALLSEVHGEVLHLPLWGKRIPAVVNNQRLSGYVPGAQQFDYPLHKARVVSGPKTVTVAPGAQTGLFTSVGRLDAHSYRPNEFFANNWVYEGLLAYGAGGKVEPALATSWTSEASADGGETFRFTLREGVTFHDGAEFNCAAVKLNFDHVFVEELTTGDWHGWYGLPGVYKESSCDGETFVLTTKTPYYPLLQELTYIRPLRMLSPTAFAGTDPVTENSCPVGWNEWLTDVTCAGATAIAGTGPWKYESRDTNADGDDDEVIFTANAEYWGGAPQFDELHIKRYADSAAVKAALLDGSLDAVVGASVLEPSDEEELGREPGFDLMYGELSQNTVIIMNIANKALRKAVVHGVNKVPIIGKELNEAYEPAETLFPPSLPYCDVDLTPKFAYDSEKSEFLCGGSAAATDDADATDDKAAAGDDGAAPSDDEGGDDKGTTGDDEGTTNDRGGGSKKKKSSNKKEETLYATLFGIAAGILALLACGVCYMASKERKGEPLFAPKPASNPMRDDLEKA